jgi:hypothetical protein
VKVKTFADYNPDLLILLVPIDQSCVANYTGTTSTRIDWRLDGQLVHRMGAIPLLSFLLNTVHVPAQLRVQ